MCYSWESFEEWAETVHIPFLISQHIERDNAVNAIRRYFKGVLELQDIVCISLVRVNNVQISFKTHTIMKQSLTMKFVNVFNEIFIRNPDDLLRGNYLCRIHPKNISLFKSCAIS